MSKEELKVKPVNQELANDDLKNVHGGYQNDECPSGVSDGNGGFKKVKICYSNS